MENFKLQIADTGESQQMAHCRHLDVSLNYFSHLGAHTACDLPNSLRVVSCNRGRCLPHKKHDIVVEMAVYWFVPVNGEPGALDL